MNILRRIFSLKTEDEMGGLNETTGQQKTVTPQGQTEVIGNVRYHENNGEIHFHDDTNNLKVAIPVAKWFSAWQKLESGEGCCLFDTERQTYLTVETVLVPPKDGNPASLDIAMTIGEVELSDDFTKLQAFSTK
jgi:hypothetical protein